MHLSARDVQRLLAAAGYYHGRVDGDIGLKSLKAIDRVISTYPKKIFNGMTDRRRIIASAQIILEDYGFDPGPIDGYSGHHTYEAYSEWAYQREHGKRKIIRANKKETLHEAVYAETALKWPYQEDVTSFYGTVGSNQTQIKLPYAMTISWNPKQKITSMTCHERVADAMTDIFQRTLDHYGLADINKLRLDQFGGCFNVRKMRCRDEYSMHSWGIAVDIDPANNRLHWGRDRARLAGMDYDAFWRIVEDAGAISLGRLRNFDWMHFQFAKL